MFIHTIQNARCMALSKQKCKKELSWFHSPLEKAELRQWLRNFGQAGWKASKYSLLCFYTSKKVALKWMFHSAYLVKIRRNIGDVEF